MPGAYEIVMEQRRELVDKIVGLMKQGQFFENAPEWNHAALSPHNPLSKARYKGGNRLRLMLEMKEKGYEDSRWATLRQFQEKGYYPKKGEHGTPCEKWIFTKERVEFDEAGNKVKIVEELKRPQVAYFKVFNAEQIQGFPKYELKELPQKELTERVQRFLASSECPVQEAFQDRAYYSPALDRIVLPPRGEFKDAASFAKTLFHEMGHSTGHPSRLNRKMGGTFGSADYAKEELRAELGALFLGADLGVPMDGEHYEDHSDYLKSWIGVLENDYNELFRACADAEKISAYLIANYCRTYDLTREEAIGSFADVPANIAEREAPPKRRRGR